MKKILSVFFALICFSAFVSAQIPVKTLVQIVKAEDELRYDKTLEDLMKSADALIRKRAALASGRIGSEAAIPALINLLEKDKDANVQAMAAFALGEIESSKAADAILRSLKAENINDLVRARATEAAGKIASANAKDEKSKELGKAILDVLKFEDGRGEKQSRETVLLGLTAILRVRPDGGDSVAAKFLTNSDARVRTDAANTLARLRSKNYHDTLRTMLQSDKESAARANAARALGAAEDKEAFDILLKAAVGDKDLRVRVSAIRALGSLKDMNAIEKLLEYGEKLLADYKKSKFANPTEKNELLEIATTLGRILPHSSWRDSAIFEVRYGRAYKFLYDFRQADKFTSPEIQIAMARISPFTYVENLPDATKNNFEENWQTNSATFQALGEIANLDSGYNELKSKVRVLLVQSIGDWLNLPAKDKAANKISFAIPDLLRAFAAFKSENTSGIIRPFLENEQDIFIRAAAAEILGEQTATKENTEALKTAFANSLKTDKDYNDAQLAILSALVKLDKTGAVSSLNLALDAPDFLVRRQAAQFIKQNDLAKDFPNLDARVGTLKPYNARTGTKLGQILNTNADYTRAVSRKNGTVKALFTTEKGTFTINLMPEDAPLTVDNFIKLAKSNYFNGVLVHRVVPNFVMQDGDPRGDGNGGPGFSIRCEMNLLEYSRGAVGMALSGKDTGGSQWFVTHSPQPHLDGGYTVFGRVNENDMKVVDSIVRGDKILNVKIVENAKTK